MADTGHFFGSYSRIAGAAGAYAYDRMRRPAGQAAVIKFVVVEIETPREVTFVSAAAPYRARHQPRGIAGDGIAARTVAVGAAGT